MAGLPYVWGATREEHARAYPADTTLDVPVRLATRAVSVDAPPAHVYRWTCQVALAPYSYDWIDNFGRRSPRELVPGADRLEVGQRMMTLFQVTDVEPGRSWTAFMLPRPARVFGPLALTYAAEPDASSGDSGTRLVCRLACGVRGLGDRLRLLPVAWGDVVMMRKQLLTFKELAEGSWAGDVSV